MLYNKLESLLNVRPDEWKETGFFWFFSFLCWIALSFGDSISDALFVKRVGVERLPLMFIICSLAAIPVSILFTLLQGRIEKNKLTIWSGLASSFAILAAVNLISIEKEDSHIACYILYFFSNLMMFVVPVVISVLVGTQFNSLKAKRLVPIIFTSIIAGRIFAGSALGYLAGRFPLPELLWLWFLVHLLAFIFFFFGCHGFVKPPLREVLGSEKERKSQSLTQKLRSLFQNMADSRLVMFLILSSILANFTYYFAEFHGAAIFNNSFPSENELARFYGFFTIFSSLIAFLFQGLITGNLIHRIGISSTNLVYPFLVFAGFSATAFSYTLIPGIWLKFVQVGLLNALFQPVNNLFYNALPSREKARTITINEGILQPLGTVATGLLLLFATKHPVLLRIMPVIAGLAWVSITILMRKPYRESLLRLLRSSNLQVGAQHELQKLNLDKKILELLLNYLEASDEQTSSLIVQLIINNGDSKKREELMGKVRRLSDEKKLEILRHVLLPVEEPTAEFLFNCLASENDELKSLALKALAPFHPSNRMRQVVLPFLYSQNQQLKRLASVIAVKIGDLNQMKEALEVIDRYISSDVYSERLKGIELIGHTSDERFWVNLRSFLHHPDIKTRLAACSALEKIIVRGDSDEFYEIIDRMIKDDSREIRKLALEMLSRLVEPKWFYLVVEGLSDSSPRNRKLAREILITNYDDMFSELIMVMESQNSSLHAKAAVAGILSASQQQSIRDYLHQFGQKMALQLYEYKVEEYVIAREMDPAHSIYIEMLLKERAWAMTRLIVCLIAPEQSREARDLFKSLYSSDDEHISNAIEVLQNMGERQLVYHIIPVLECISLDQVAAYGMKAFSIREKELKVILGKYLSSNDDELKEAAVYTICKAGIKDLLPMLKKIRHESNSASSVFQTCDWAINCLAPGQINNIETRSP